MKCFHVHVAVSHLARSIDFYSKLFWQAPTTERHDYAKWILDDPRVNFAISARGHASGVNHLGFQADSAEELRTLKERAQTASGGQVLDQGVAACCYASSEKHWIIDPQELVWEYFHTMSEALEFGSDTAGQTSGCCIPPGSTVQDAEQAKSACCLPQADGFTAGACCN